ncbi:MAG: superoxide dismutase family protein [Actinomycetota bacterium]|nr:superoxide dismutase family protein [Actinomycetota bacterium]MDQ3721099.1 superoxide dismutase family protein [Actinomycetota bacterium]
MAALSVLALALVTTAESGSKGQGKRAKKVAHASLKSADGSRAAKVRIVERRNGKVVVVVRARGLQPGFHGFHVHEKGVCEPPAFTSAGGHLERDGQDHGAHAGDMPPLLATDDGKARAEFVTDSFHIRQLLAGDGSAIMIHAGRDNLANVPTRYKSGTTAGPDEETLKTGDSGSRVACGVVQRKRR